MTKLQKFWYSVCGWLSCITWMIKELYPDLAFWNPPTHPEDFIWYAERVNGRLAMLAVTAILIIELTTKSSILDLVHGL